MCVPATESDPNRKRIREAMKIRAWAREWTRTHAVTSSKGIPCILFIFLAPGQHYLVQVTFCFSRIGYVCSAGLSDCSCVRNGMYMCSPQVVISANGVFSLGVVLLSRPASVVAQVCKGNRSWTKSKYKTRLKNEHTCTPGLHLIPENSL